MDYKEVLQGYLEGWDDEQEEEIRQEAIKYIASKAGEVLSEEEPLIETEVFEDLVDGKETAQTEQLQSALLENYGWGFPQESVKQNGEEQYAKKKVEEALEDYDGWDVKTVFKYGDRKVNVKIPGARTLDVVSQFQDYEGSIDLQAEKSTSATVEPSAEEDMREQLTEPEEWDNITVHPDIQFNGGKITYSLGKDSPLIISAEQYTDELEDVLDEFGL